MTRPHVIRADTIDLQDPDAPSAKDHSRQPARPGMLGEGSPAPHQAEALKHVELEISEQHGRSPRASTDLSGKELQLLHDEAEFNGHQDPSENLLRNSTQHATQDEVDDGDGDDGLDEDMGDKISSSPSIGDDGGYSVPRLPSPTRSRSISTPPKKASHTPGPPNNGFSSSPFEETPTHFPLSVSPNRTPGSPSKDHHQRGEYGDNGVSGVLVDEIDMEQQERRSRNASEASSLQDYVDAPEFVDEGLDLNDFHHLLLPDDDPLLDNSFDDGPGGSETSTVSETPSPASKASWDPNSPDEPTDDDFEDISYDLDSRFVDSGWGGECLREIEDIDFDFVYALHTFVATVEGQANATKGDTMVLLDDSNSYWWLIRVVKDSSIGYLPAEHIETPLERLARLNKHRNLDLSQTMVTDHPDDTKTNNPLNPLRKAMRRRNVKKVDFAATNSFLEPDDTVYSSSEDEDGDSELHGQDAAEAGEQKQEQSREDDQDATVAPLNTKNRTVNGRHPDETGPEVEDRSAIDRPNGVDQPRDSDEMYDRNEEGTNKSRKGTVRNTDSFFKDESQETRKINLTPSLLRDDSAAATGPQQSELIDSRIGGSSLDSLEKDAPPENKKDERKKKEKRGMLGMFKWKDKKSKDKERDEDNEKTSAEMERKLKSPTPKESMESLSSSNQSTPSRQTSKLQKQRPANLSPKTSHAGPAVPRPASAGEPSAPVSELDRQPSSAGSDMRLVLPESQPLFDGMPSPLQSKQHSPQDPASANSFKQAESPKDRDISAFNKPVSVQRPAPIGSQPAPIQQPIHSRMRGDDSDSSSAESTEQPVQRTISHESQEDRVQRTISHTSQERLQRSTSHDLQEEPVGELVSQPSDQHLEPAQATPHEAHPVPSREGLSESPMEVSPTTAHERTTPYQPPPLMSDNSSPSPSSAPVSPPSSPEIADAPPLSTGESDKNIVSTAVKATAAIVPATTENDVSASPASTAPPNGTGRSLPAWSDASLRAYMEDDSDIRDLLIIVHDKTGVVARKDHPVVQGLFKEENAKLRDIEKGLDRLLGDFYRRKGRR